MRSKDFYEKLSEYINRGFILDSTYDIEEEFNITEISSSFIRISLPNIPNHSKVWRENIKKKFRTSIVDGPSINELGYKDSIELLFSHYQYGITYNSSCVLTNYRGEVIAVSYIPGVSKIDFIESDVPQRDYILYNIGEKISLKKLNKKYNRDQITLLINELQKGKK